MFDEYYSNGFWTKDTTASLWDKNARLYPEKAAYISPDGSQLSWSEVKKLSDQLAFQIRKLGVKKDDFIFMLLPNCVESYIFRVACEKAGVLCGTALMTLREWEIEQMLSRFEGVAIAIPIEFRKFGYYDAVAEIKTRLPKLKHIMVLGDQIPEGTLSINAMMHTPIEKKQPIDFSDTAFTADEVSVIGFTSGTTGLPKGAEHTQVQRIYMAHRQAEAIKLTADDMVLNIISAVAGLSSIVCYNGSNALYGTTSIVQSRWSVESTLELLEKYRVTVLLAVPAQLAKIANAPELDKYDLRSLRCVYTSTAPLPHALAKEIEEKLGCIIVNLYGQFDGGLISITSVDTTEYARYNTVGKPVKGMTVKIVDDDSNEVPTDQLGEIIYTGPGITAGYYLEPDFTENATYTIDGRKYIKSGDIGKVDADGNIYLVSRKKDVIIRGGQNVYPAEIEGYLLMHPKVVSAAVIPMPDPVMGEKACAYVALQPGAEFSFEEMKELFDSKKIAPYKIPERLEIRKELPMRGHQKVTKKELQQELEAMMRQEAKQ